MKYVLYGCGETGMTLPVLLSLPLSRHANSVYCFRLSYVISKTSVCIYNTGLLVHYNHFMALWILSGTTRVNHYQKSKTSLDFTEARDSEWQWHQLGHMQICTSLQTDNHTGTPPLSFLQAGCPSCHPTNSVKSLKANVKALKALA